MSRPLIRTGQWSQTKTGIIRPAAPHTGVFDSRSSPRDFRYFSHQSFF